MQDSSSARINQMGVDSVTSNGTVLEKLFSCGLYSSKAIFSSNVLPLNNQCAACVINAVSLKYCSGRSCVRKWTTVMCQKN